MVHFARLQISFESLVDGQRPRKKLSTLLVESERKGLALFIAHEDQKQRFYKVGHDLE